MLPIPSFHHGWPNLKSICTPSPKLDSVISKVHVSQNMILTSLGENHRVHMHTLFKISTLYLQYILFTFNSHLDYAQSMAVWCLNWWLVEMFEVLSKSWSQNLPRHSSKLKKERLWFFATSDYFLSHQIIHFIWSQNSFLWILKSFDCWHVSWIEYLEFWIFWYCFM